MCLGTNGTDRRMGIGRGEDPRDSTQGDHYMGRATEVAAVRWGEYMEGQ